MSYSLGNSKFQSSIQQILHNADTFLTQTQFKIRSYKYIYDTNTMITSKPYTFITPYGKIIYQLTPCYIPQGLPMNMVSG